jgi:hypothetical protein
VNYEIHFPTAWTLAEIRHWANARGLDWKFIHGLVIGGEPRWMLILPLWLNIPCIPDCILDNGAAKGYQPHTGAETNGETTRMEVIDR